MIFLLWATLSWAATDADGDGFAAPEDCDDLDPAIFPGAPDAWYDGVDADCAGNDDYDADADGYRSAEYSGDDCDDAHASVRPGAADVFYDGIDADCVGNDDYDADGDGFATNRVGGDDCDDADPAVHPGAPDVPGDLVDQDCDGEATAKNADEGSEDPQGCAGGSLTGAALLWGARRQKKRA